MHVRSRSSLPARVDLQMTSMIDVVFQLLIFFVLSFRVLQQEGDLTAKMPLALNEDQPARDFDLPLSVRLRADAKGQLAGIEIGEQRLANPDALRAMLEHHSATNRAAEPTLDVDLVCDEHLRYEHVMAALTAVSGKRVGDEIIRLARDVRISSPR